MFWHVLFPAEPFDNRSSRSNDVAVVEKIYHFKKCTQERWAMCGLLQNTYIIEFKNNSININVPSNFEIL